MYDGRVKTTAAKLHHITATAGDSCARLDSGRQRQRKWRVLLSIGLLLPALAAIIGIVAWAISIEVANGGGGQRKLAPAQQLVQPQSQPLVQRHLFARRRQPEQVEAQQEQQQPHRSVAAGDQQNSAAPIKRLPVSTKQQQLVLERPTNEKEIKPEATNTNKRWPAAGEGHFEQALAVTDAAANGGGKRAKSESGSTKPPKNSVREVELDASEADHNHHNQELSESEPAEREIETEDDERGGAAARGKAVAGAAGAGDAELPEASLTKATAVASPDSSNGKRNNNNTDDDDDDDDDDEKLLTNLEQALSGSTGAPKAYQKSSSAAVVETSTTTTVTATSITTQRPIYGANSEDANSEMIPTGHKSRWLSGKTNKKPMNQMQQHSPASAAVAPTVSRKQRQHENVANNKPLKASGKIARLANAGSPGSNHQNNNNRYFIEEKSNKEKVEDEAEIGVGESPTTTMARNSEGRSSSLDLIEDAPGDALALEVPAKSQLASSSNKSNGGNKMVMKPLSSASEGSLQEKQKRHRDDLDEELSFEAIASAISTSLSAANHHDEERRRLPLPAEGDTGALFDQQDEVPPSGAAVEAIVAQQQQQQQHQQRRRTAGEHVAEVIDQLVEQRKHQQQAAQLRHHAGLRGPQIVVVAPVGSSAMGMKARSLTKAADGGVRKAQSDSSGSVELDKRITEKKARRAEMQSSKKTTSKRTKPIGARLLGVEQVKSDKLKVGKNSSTSTAKATETAEPTVKYSERVEVIEDDDSSAFLLMKSPPSRQQADEEEANGRGQEAEAPPRQSMMPTSDDESASIHVSSHSGEARSRSPRHESSASRMLERYAPIQPQQLKPQPRLYSAEQLIREHVLKSKGKHQAPSDQQQLVTANKTNTNLQTKNQQVKVIPTTVRPQQQQQPSGSIAEPEPIRQQPGEQQANFGQSVRVPLFIHQKPAPQQQSLETYQALESQQLFSSSGSSNSAMDQQRQPAELSAKQPRTAHQSQQQQNQFDAVQEPVHHLHHHHHHHMQQQHQLQQLQQPPASSISQLNAGPQSALPVFADQEYNVPAHMAESVIQNLQRAAPSMGLINGQPALVSSGLGQVPYQQQQQLLAAAAQSQPFYLPPAATPQQQQQQAGRHLSQGALIGTNFRQQQLHQQRQVLSERNGIEGANGGGASSSLPTKGVASRVHPLAQMALKHLINSMAQQAESQQRSADSSMQAAGSAPIASAMLPNGEAAPSKVSASRAMRSLPIGAQDGAAPMSSASSLSQQVVGDQEMQESYGQMPTYHMAQQGHGYGGQAEQHYQSDHDKRSKGITFHFGGGPIGGGTQLITSPMGIFKHLMIPLLPNPRVNLNGKVVFGVVLEKSTAIGEPKKKYKFWGR